MIKRFLRIIGFLITLPFAFIELSIFIIKWIVTGNSNDFPEKPLCIRILFNDFNKDK